jgi:hypothetical protein
MSVRVAAVAAAVLGGALWIFRSLADAPVAVHWVGLVLVAGSLAPVGARLVSGVVPVRVVVAVALPLLVASLVELVRPADPGWFDGVLGAVTVVVAVGVLAATAQPAVAESRHRAH